MNTPGVPSRPALLLVDDDPLITDTLSIVLGREFAVTCADSHDSALARLDALTSPPTLAVVDLGLPPTPHAPHEGYRLIGSLLTRAPRLKIVVLSGQSEDSTGRHARALGAVEFVAKPARPADLLRVLGKVAAAAAAEAGRGSEPVPADDALAGLIGTSPAMRSLKSRIRLYADSPFSVLIEGESGSGKELIAAALHKLSGRRDRPFLVLNCAALPPAQVEPVLFGHARDAFAGASGERAGYCEEARDGTLLLDEIGGLPLDLQAKLLQVLENGEYHRVGESVPRRSHARIVAATHRDLRAESRNGGFRADLYHRLSVLGIRVPPLREMGEDKLLLLEHFRALYAPGGSGPQPPLDADARRLWLDYPFPGNVRELRNVVIRLVTRAPDRALTPADIEPELDSGATLTGAPQAEGPFDAVALDELGRGSAFNLDLRLASWERAYIAAAMKLANGNVSQAARALGINRTTLYSRMSALERDA